jgi:nitronate monooxygenase
VEEDLELVIKHKAEIVIASVGSPDRIIAPLHKAGCLVLADIASMRHAEKAIASGVDGLVLLTAGAGGQTGWANPFAFARAVREIDDGIIVMAGGISDGVALHAAEQLGCDLSYMGTKFIATRESMAVDRYKQMLVDCRLDDVKPSIVAAGLDPENLPVRGSLDISKDINAAERDKPTAKRWKDIWSAGHSVSGVSDIPSVAELVARTKAEYQAAKAKAA